MHLPDWILETSSFALLNELAAIASFMYRQYLYRVDIVVVLSNIWNCREENHIYMPILDIIYEDVIYPVICVKDILEKSCL